MAELQVRRAMSTDVPKILETLRLSLGENPLLRRTPDLWSWKHEKNPFGESLVLVATDGDVIAGVRAFMRWELETSDRTRLRCVRAVDTATHPDHMRKGLFRRLTETAVELATEDGVDLIFNTPNEKSAPGYLKMGWKLVSPIGVQVRPVFGKAAGIGTDEVPSLEKIAPGIGSFGEVEYHDRTPAGLRTPRTPEYLAWRFQAHPTASYGWLGNGPSDGIVVRASHRGGRPELVISDVLGTPPRRLMGTVAGAAKTRYLAGWFSPGNPARRYAIRAGLLPLPGVKTLQLVARPLRPLPIDPFHLRSWDIATSDLELL